MPLFEVTDPNSGLTLELTGDSAPTEQELEQIFAQQAQPAQQPGLAQQAAQEQAQQLNPLEAGLISTGRGFTNVGRAVGLVEPEQQFEQQTFGALQEEFPIASEVGQAVGEAAPFLLPGTALGAIPKLAPRVAAAVGLGVSEGAIVAKGRGGDIEQQAVGAGLGGAIAGTAEAVFPIIGRIGGRLIRSITGKAPEGAVLDAAGNPSPELKEALEQSGVSFDELTQQATETLRQTAPGADPQQAARLARLESLGAPATKGDITGEFAQQAQEARLVESAADTLSDPLRALRLEQSQAFKQQLDEQVEKLGVPENVGDSLKSAIEGRKKLLTSEKNALYREVAEAAPEVRSIPLLTGTIEEAMPDDKTIRRLSRISGNQASAVDDLLVEFGVQKDATKIKDFLDTGGSIEPLNLGNFEEFRVALGQIERADTTGSSGVIIGPIRKALDGEANLIDDAIQRSGLSDEGLLATLREARGKVRELKTELSPQSISGRLIDVKRDGVTPVIESSKVFKDLLGAGKAPELLERTIETLSKGGTKGKRAIGDLQAATIMDLMNSAFGAQTRKISGERTFGAVAFNKRLEQIGDRRLNALFKNQPATLRKIQAVSKTAADLTPPSGAVPKGSASVILDSLNKLGIMSIMGKVPGGALFAETIRTVADKSANRQVLERALNAKPAVRRMASFIADDFPGLASPLGIAFLAEEQQ